MKIEYNNIVSLGKDCMSRTIPTRFLLKKKKEDGELTLPFDLAIHRYDAVCQLIESDFQGYTNPSNLMVENGVIIHKKYFVRYTHEKSKLFFDNNFKLLIDKYKNRVENFHKYINNNNVLFVSTFPLYPIELRNVIKNKFPNLAFKIINFDVRPFNETENIYRSDAYKLNEEDIIYIRAPVPHKDYIWWKEEHNISTRGYEFESYLAYWIKKTLDEGLHEN